MDANGGGTRRPPEGGRDPERRGPKRGDGGSSRATGDGGRGGQKGGRRGDEAEAVRLRSKLLSLLKRLPDVERRVLEARMGLIDGQPMKPGEVATLMGMTIPEVKKIEARAFERIREIGSLKGLEKFLQT